MTSLREEITAAICEVNHQYQHPTPAASRQECATSLTAADAIMRILAAKFDADWFDENPADPDIVRCQQSWSAFRHAALICLGIDSATTNTAVTR